MGKLAYDLGEVYKIIGPEHINGQVLAYSMQLPGERLEKGIHAHESWSGGKSDVRPETLRRAVQTITEIIEPLNQSQMKRDDATTIKAEFQQAANLLLHSAHRLLFLLDEDGSPKALQDELQNVLAKQRELWLSRNRSGGLDDSLKRFETINNEYEKLLKS
jgi:hypothetical protein